MMLAALLVTLLAGVPCALASPGSSTVTPSAGVVDEIDRIVHEHFYAPDRLASLHWDAAVGHARVAVAAASDPASRTAALRELLTALSASHTAYYPREDPAFWQLAGIFEPYLSESCPKLARFPLTVADIGVFWKQIDSAWWVAGLHAGGPADKAGFKLGDQVVRAGSAPFSPVVAFAGRSGKPTQIEVLRGAQAASVHLTVVPETVRPHEELLKATQDSWQILARGGRRVAYLHVWSWTGQQFQDAVQEAIVKSNQAGVDGFVLDLRDGWGGASPHYLGIFDTHVPVMQTLQHDGSAGTVDEVMRKPAVVLINNGTHSGKEIFAYGVKEHHLARLVGERTGGAVLGGSPFCLSDGALLFLAVSDVRIDGARLEGVGVEPDVEVPFDLRHADGQDPQLDKALELLTH